MATVAVGGASGYAGQETLDRVLTHSALELYALGSDSLTGEAAAVLDPRLDRNGQSRIPRFITNDAALSCGADVTFVCLPHRTAAEVTPPPRGVVVDLSGASEEEAVAVARRIATLPLVKTAAFGHDPNWGACSQPPLRAVERRLRTDRRRSAQRRFRRHPGLRPREGDRGRFEPRRSGRVDRARPRSPRGIDLASRL
jgi:hypothetical protein